MTFKANLEAYYKFNDNGLDSSENARDLSFSGTEAYTTGKFNSGYSLSGSDADFATGPTDSALDFSGAGADGPGWSLSKLSTQAFRFGGTSPSRIDSASLASTGSFLHLLVRSDGSDVEMFLNGSSVATSAAFAISSTANPLLIGERQGSQSFPVNGVIDEVALWSRDLSDSEIAQLYNSGSGLELPDSIQSTPFIFTKDAPFLPRPSAPFRYIRDAAFVPRPSEPFRYTRGTPAPTLIVNKQITTSSINVDRLAFNTIRVLSTTSVDLTATGITTLFTTPIINTAIALGIILEPTTATSVTVDSQISLGINETADDIFPLEITVDLRTTSDLWSNWLILSNSRAASSSQLIKINVQTGATASALTADVHLVGFLI